MVDFVAWRIYDKDEMFMSVSCRTKVLFCCIEDLSTALVNKYT